METRSPLSWFSGNGKLQQSARWNQIFSLSYIVETSARRPLYLDQTRTLRSTWDAACGHKAKDITSSIAWRREAWKEEALDDLPLKGRERAGTDNRTNIGTGDIGTISERRGGAHMGFSECIDITLNWTELNWGDPVNDLLRSRQKDRVVLCIRTILSKLWSSLQRAVMHSPKETLCTQLLSLSVCSVISLWADQFSSSLSAP